MHGPCRARWLSRLGDSLKELLWPLGRFCILCGVATRSQSLCPQCLANLKACALPLAHQHPGMTAADGLCAAFAYEDAAKRMPKVESFVQTPDGPGNVKSVDLLRETMKVALDSAGPNEPPKCYHNCEVCVLRNGKGSRDGIAIPERPARYVEEKEEEEIFDTPILATPFYMDAKLEDAPVREKMGRESGDGKPRRRHRGGRRNRSKTSAEGVPQQPPAKAEAKPQEEKKGQKPRTPKPQAPKQPPASQPKGAETRPAAEGGESGGETKRRRPRHRGGRRRNKGGSGGSAPQGE